MVMLLPFLLGTLAVWFGLRGRRGASFTFWILTLVLFAVTTAGQWHLAPLAGLRL
ncbi:MULTISPECIES: DUF5993 family protein [Alcaligenaceae]|uniref:DUF5993 family protein n=1 Tax=Bordetella genomosp. 10 TaxID=1416804 RepID=UPI0015C58A57|nr:DUF5993 family protein [Bordetella genomosp. 10]